MSLWPRGVSKEKIDLWMQELGTEPSLIKQWKAEQISWEQFAKEYKKSLKGKEAHLREIAKMAKLGNVTLLCSCKDEKHCHRSLLKAAIDALL